MNDIDRLRGALRDLLRELHAGPEKLVDLNQIGVPLVGQGFTQHQIVDLLLSLERQGVIGRIENNKLRLMKAFDQSVSSSQRQQQLNGDGDN